jgi:hypothetical protein
MATAARSPGEEIAKRRSRHGYALDLRVACSLYFGAVNQINKPEAIRGCIYPSENDGDCASRFCRIRSSVPSLGLFKSELLRRDSRRYRRIRNPQSAIPTAASCSNAGRADAQIGAVFWRKSFRRAVRRCDAVFGFLYPNGG